MKNATEIENNVMDYIRQELLGDNDIAVDPEDNLITSGLVDSVGAMRLIAHIESTLNITIPPPNSFPKTSAPSGSWPCIWKDW
jgi:acyl carrier protein